MYNNNLLYKNKYIKYKNKYIELKNMSGGALYDEKIIFKKKSNLSKTEIFVIETPNTIKISFGTINAVPETILNKKSLFKIEKEYFFPHFLLYYLSKPDNILIIGLGGGFLNNFINKIMPNVKIDVIELDSTVVDAYNIISEKLNFNNTNSNIITDDGIEFINKTNDNYNLVFLDVGFESITLKFNFEKISKIISNNGALFINIWLPNYNEDNIKNILKKYFKIILFFKPKSTNVTIICLNSTKYKDYILDHEKGIDTIKYMIEDNNNISTIIEKNKLYFQHIEYGNSIDTKEKNFINLLNELHSYSYKLFLPDNEKTYLLNKYKSEQNCNTLTYGYTPYFGFFEIIEKINSITEIDKSRKFICLGSSHGNFVFYANYLLNMNSIGYDISITRINKSKEIMSKFNINNVNFINKSAEDVEYFSKSSLIWLSDLCWPTNIIKFLSNKIKKECKQCWIIYMSQHHTFNNYNEIEINASWGKQRWKYIFIE